MRLESISRNIKASILVAALIAGCSSVSKTTQPVIYSPEKAESPYKDEKKEEKKRTLYDDYQEYCEMVKNYISLPPWKRVPF